MKLRVKADAKKGHQVADPDTGQPVMVEPGDELPGDYDAIPQGMEGKLEEVASKGAKKGEQPPTGGTGPLQSEPPGGPRTVVDTGRDQERSAPTAPKPTGSGASSRR